MAIASKAIFLAVGIGLAGTAQASAAEATRPAPQAGDPANENRLEDLLSTIEQQSAKLQQQQADIEHQRAELEKQKAELMALKARMSAASSPKEAPLIAAQPAPHGTATASSEHAEIVRTRYGYIPLPRIAPRGAPQTQTAAAAREINAPTPDGAVESMPAQRPDVKITSAVWDSEWPKTKTLVGRTVKNDLGIPAPQTTAEQTAADAAAPARLHTLKDLIRAATAPTLSGQSSAGTSPSEVGEKPKSESTGIDIAVLADRGGVLTPRGTLVVTPNVQYTHSSADRFFFDGVEVVQAVLIGDFLAQQVSRDSVSGGLTFNYGITKRLAIDTDVSWLYQSDRTLNTNLLPSATLPSKILFNLNGNDLGDVDFGIHYQINNPKGLFPYFVANLRGKADNGKGPYDVARDLQTGLETELPSGSGFWSVEPSLTMIFPSDPAILFANIGYQWNPQKGVNKLIQDSFVDEVGAQNTPDQRKETTTFIGNVDPGDALTGSVGMGIGVNDSVSLSFGYQHTWVFGTNTEQTQTVFVTPLECIPLDTTDPANCTLGGGTTIDSRSHGFVKSSDAQIGELLMGASVNINGHVGVNFNVAVGTTADAPDVQITLRTPLTFRLYH
jgi:hypothetical protein